MADLLYTLTSLLPLPVWLSMLLFPSAGFTRRMVLSPWPIVVLAGAYAVLLATAAIAAPGVPSLDADALRALLASRWGFLAGWAHYLCLDLFAGIWIFRDAKYYGIRPWPYLLATLFVGPIGLGAWLLRRRAFDRKDPVRRMAN